MSLPTSPLRLLPTAATFVGWDSHPLKFRAFSRRTMDGQDEQDHNMMQEKAWSGINAHNSGPKRWILNPFSSPGAALLCPAATKYHGEHGIVYILPLFCGGA